MKLATRRAQAALFLMAVALILLGAAPRAQALQCDSCVTAVDNCCEKMPQIQDPTFPMPAAAAIETREPDPSNGNFCVTLFDITTNIPTENTNWSPLGRYHGPGGSWTAANLGTVFGLTLDKYGNIFVTHTTAYSVDLLGPGGAGAVYRIDGITGAITTFVTLPNTTSPQVGLGNITYDCDHDQFFVTDEEDGRIYRIKAVGVNGPTGTVLDFFDPGAPDNGAAGFAPLGERLWGVQWHANRVYYSVWATDFASPPAQNSIRSVALDGVGDFSWWSDRLELLVPSYPSTPGQSGPVSDLSFGPTGRMLLGERSMYGPTSPGAHNARILEYECRQQQWVPVNNYAVGTINPQTNSAGGVDYDYAAYNGPSPPATALPGLGGSAGRVWCTADAIHFGNPDVIYGLQAFRPTGGSIANSLLIDNDGIVNGTDKTYMGDVEVPCAGGTTGGGGTIGGQKFLDVNFNGVKDGGEPGLGGWTITLSGPVNMTTTTAANGTYSFSGLPPGTYTVCEGTQPSWVLTLPNSGCYTVVLGPNGTILNQDFGNRECGSGPCVLPPTGMVSWWPLDETVGALSHDVIGPNNGVWMGGASPAVGEVNGAISVPTITDFVEAPNNATLNFGLGSFSIDAWVYLNDVTTQIRTIVDKRSQVAGQTNPAGYQLLLFQNKLAMQVADGASTANVVSSGPVLPLNTWTHVASVVDRVAGTITLYVNGSSVGVFPVTPVTGGVSNTGKLRIGQREAFQAPQAFAGLIDEVEIFKKALTIAEVQSIWLAGSNGKCKSQCYVPTIRSFTSSSDTLTVCFQLCNFDWTQPHTYTWTLAGLPVGAGCTIAGPTVFSPSAGTTTVGPGQCVSVCVTIKKPAGMTAAQVACYQLTTIDKKTGRCFSCSGKLTIGNVINPNWPTGVLVVPSSAPLTFTFDIGNGGGTPGGSLSYTLRGVPASKDTVDNKLRLNGLPPGTPVTGSISIPPGGTGSISVTLDYGAGGPVHPLDEIILEADTDGDGVPEPINAVFSEPEESQPLSAPQNPDAVGRVEGAVGYPNPFDVNTGVRFSLEKAQKVDVRVYDVNGRLVRTLESGQLTPGAHYVPWNGFDSNGQRADNGIYFIRVQTGDRTQISKVVRLK